VVALGDVDVVSECLRSIDGVEFAIWFGSSCRGRMHKFSDLDVGVYVSRDLSVRELMDKIPFLERLVDLKILNNAPPLFRLRVLREGKILFAKDESVLKRFIYETLVEALEYKETYERILKRFSERVLHGV